jgi:hypothetical protein
MNVQLWMHVRIALPVVADSRQGVGNGILAGISVRIHNQFFDDEECGDDFS